MANENRIEAENQATGKARKARMISAANGTDCGRRKHSFGLMQRSSFTENAPYRRRHTIGELPSPLLSARKVPLSSVHSLKVS